MNDKISCICLWIFQCKSAGLFPIFILLLLLFNNEIAGSEVKDEYPAGVNVQTWIQAHFAKGQIPPFSFIYGLVLLPLFFYNFW